MRATYSRVFSVAQYGPRCQSPIRFVSFLSVGIDSIPLAVLPDRKTGGRDTVFSASFAYTLSRLKRYRHTYWLGRADFVTECTTSKHELKRKAERHTTPSMTPG